MLYVYQAEVAVAHNPKAALSQLLRDQNYGAHTARFYPAPSSRHVRSQEGLAPICATQAVSNGELEKEPPMMGMSITAQFTGICCITRIRRGRGEIGESGCSAYMSGTREHQLSLAKKNTAEVAEGARRN